MKSPGTRTVSIAAFALTCVTAAFAQEPAAVVATFAVRPGNPAVSPDGRLFMSIHPLTAPDVKFVEVLKDGKTVPFPNEEWSLDAPGRQARIAGGIGIRIGEDGVAWMLDMGDASRVPKLVGWDTGRNRLHKVITLPNEALGSHPFLQDFALDQNRRLAIIADPGAGRTAR